MTTLAPRRAGASGLAPMIAAALLWGTIGPSVVQLERHSDLTSADISFERAVIASLALAAFVAFDKLGIGPATLVTLGLGPLLVALGEAVFLGRRPAPRLLLVIAASLAGMGLLVLGSGSAAPAGASTLAGLALAAGSAATYAGVVLAAGPASHALGPARLNLLVFAGVVVSLAPVVAVSGLELPSGADAIALTAYLGLIASAVAYGLYFVATKTLKSTVVSVFALLEPLTAAVLAWIVFGQALGPLGIAGGAIMLAGVVDLSGQDDLVAEAAIGTAIPESGVGGDKCRS